MIVPGRIIYCTLVLLISVRHAATLGERFCGTENCYGILR